MSKKTVNLSLFQWPEFYTDCRLFCFRMLFSFYGYYPTEEEIFGIGEGLNLKLQNVSTLSTKIYCPIGRHLNFELDYGKKVHIPIEIGFFEEGSVEETIYPIIKKIESDHPVVANVDRYYLNYLSIERAHVGFHAILVVGYDAQKRTLTIIDSLAGKETIEIPYELFCKAVKSDCLISTKRMWYYIDELKCIENVCTTKNDIILSIYNTSERIINRQIEPLERFEATIKGYEIDKIGIYQKAKKYIDIQNNLFFSTFKEQDRTHYFYRKLFILFLNRNIDIFPDEYKDIINKRGNQLLESINSLNQSQKNECMPSIDPINNYIQCEKSLHTLLLRAIKLKLQEWSPQKTEKNNRQNQ